MKNIYLQETKKKIGNYFKTKDLINLRRIDIELCYRQLEIDVDELKRERTKRIIKKLEHEIMGLEKDIEAIDRGFQHLDLIASKIVDLKYRKKESWVAVGIETGYCQSRVKEIGKESLLIIGEYLYGIDIHQDLPIVAGAGCY